MSDLIGIDLKLVNDDLSCSNTGDLQLVEGIENIWQSMYLRLKTTLGTYLFADEYGTRLGEYIEEPLTDDLKKEIVSECKNTILKDSRIVSVSVTSIQMDSGINLYISITTINGESKSGYVNKIGG